MAVPRVGIVFYAQVEAAAYYYIGTRGVGGWGGGATMAARNRMALWQEYGHLPTTLATAELLL